MTPLFADPRLDFVFKRAFGPAAKRPLVAAFLNHLLELEGDQAIVDLQHVTPLEDTGTDLKPSVLDVVCTIATGERFLVEVQVLKSEGTEKHLVYNANKAYVMQLRDASDSNTVCNVVSVTICNFELWSKRDANGRHKVPMLSRWRMQEQHGGAVGLPQVQYVFLELPKYAGGHDPQSAIDKWAYFFREARNMSTIPRALSEGPLREALEAVRTATFTPAEWEAYERARMAEQDARGALASAHQDGVAQGHRSGFAIGKAEAILAVLNTRGIPVEDSVRAHVLSCTDAATLDRWLIRAVMALSAEDIIDS